MTQGESNTDSAPTSPSDDPSPLDEKPPRPAWQPLTPRGVAAFAHGTFGRVLLMQLIVALLAAGTVVWFLTQAWFPTVREGIRQLPEGGAIRHQELRWPAASATPLIEVEGQFLGFAVDTQRQMSRTLSSDVQVEFHKHQFRICSLFGCFVFPYPKEWSAEFNRPELEPWWGAWEPVILGMVAFSVSGGLMLTWILLATLYCPFVRTLAYFKDRDLTWGGSWRIAAAGLMPGALLFTASIFFYGLGAFDLIRLMVLAILHWLIGWTYLVFSTLVLPRLPAVVPPSLNPFAAEALESGESLGTDGNAPSSKLQAPEKPQAPNSK